jgi:hypothetical protein
VINVSSVEALDHKGSGKAKVFTNFERFFVNVLCCKVFCHATVVSIAKFVLVYAIIKQVVHVDVVYVALNLIHVYVLLGWIFVAAFTL